MSTTTTGDATRTSLPTALRRLTDLCDRFESDWKAGLGPKIEDYLAEAFESDRPTLLRGLLELELGLRDSRGDRPTAPEYLGRFPEQATLVDSVFAERKSLANQPATAEATITHRPGEPDPFATQPHRSGPAGDEPAATRISAPGERGHPEGPAIRGESGGARRFRAVRRHAEGGLGIVYVALDTELNREVALKEIRPQYADDERSRLRFCLEAEVTGGLEHPGIVPVYSLGLADDGRPHYAMRFIRGESLKDSIARFHQGTGGRERPADDPGARELELRGLLRRFVDVCNAMAYAHSRGVIHRDLKPANIMIGAYGETLVVDWGLAKLTGRGDGDEATMPTPAAAVELGETRAGAAMGTPAYMSPEQARGEIGRLGPATDIFSLGGILSCILTGKPPIAGSKLDGVLERAGRGEVTLPRSLDPSIPRPLEAIALKAMNADVELRYPTARALADDVERWLADEPVAAWRDPLLVRLRRWSRRHRTLVAGLATLVLTVLVALAVSTWLIAREQQRTARQRDLARRYFLQARGAVDRFLTRVSGAPQLDVPELRPLRTALLADALAYYEAFAAQPQPDADEAGLRLELAEATSRLAQIDAMLGARPRALERADRARALYEALLAEAPGDPARTLDLAGLLRLRGDVLADLARFDDAGAAYDQSRMLLEGLTRREPAPLGVRAALARTFDSLGELEHRRGRREAALGAFRQSLELREAVADQAVEADAAPGAATDARLGRAQALARVGMMLAELGRRPESIASYDQAREILADLAGDGDDESARSDVLNELARVDHHLAAIRLAAGDRAGAIEGYRRSLEARERLVAANTVASYLSDLAKGHSDLGATLRLAGQAGEAADALKESLHIREGLVRHHRQVAQYRRGLAESLNALGKLLLLEKKTAEAAPLHERARDLLDEIVEADPGDIPARTDLALTLDSLAALDLQAGRPDDAERALGRARAIREELVEEQPDDAQLRHFLANSESRLADLREKAAEWPDALVHHRRAREIRAATLARFPDDVDARFTLATAEHNVGNALLKLDRPDEAAESFRRAIEGQRQVLEREPSRAAMIAPLMDLHHDYLGRALRASGLADEAERAAEDRIALKPDDPQQLVKGASDLARLLPLLDAAGAEADRVRVAGRALDVLGRAIDRGFTDVDRLRKAPEFEPLRRLRGDDFGAVIDRIGGAQKPPGDG